MRDITSSGDTLSAGHTTGQKPTIFRKDYQPPVLQIEHTQLTVQIFDDHAINTVKLQFKLAEAQPVFLHGQALELIEVCLDGALMAPSDYYQTEEGLTIEGLPLNGELTIKARCNPYTNTALEGLYLSGDMLCTQCEPEGFRRICFFPDRPDVMSCFDVRIEADRKYPHLLSNGNLIETGDLEEGRHYACWQDPHPKPSYLFALVAGDLERVEDSFTTAEGREVALHIYVEKGNAHLTRHAMESLKRSMAWDERAYGLAYDLDLFQIVAVSHFNMGAMENKGLNIFNSKFVLADENTATDDDLNRVEAIIAHEYFHNWSGNRVTCRDWFQLTLKEGLTVFREQQFVADMHDAGVKRVEDVSLLKAIQFPEDSSPTAHPIRPDSYQEINNFYTPTVYEKGAEVIRMMHTMLGSDRYRKGIDLYFQRHDGKAVTCDDFQACMAEANQLDLSLFARWYEQAGTPHLEVTRKHTVAGLSLNLAQYLPKSAADTSHLAQPSPLPIPLRLSFLDEMGTKIAFTTSEHETSDTEQVILLDDAALEVVITPADERDSQKLAKATPSLLRGFSAPVKMADDLSLEERLHLASYDDDLFNRWDAIHRLLLNALKTRLHTDPDAELESALAASFVRLLEDQHSRDDFKACVMTLPSQAVVEGAIKPADPVAIYWARYALQGQLAKGLGNHLHDRLQQAERLAQDSSGRALLNRMLDWALAGDVPDSVQMALRQSQDKNMTLSSGAVQALNKTNRAERKQALAAFEQRWSDAPLVLEKWFAAEASAPYDGTIERLEQLMTHPQFDIKNPNKLRSVLGVFAAGNPVQFHKEDGSGYHYMAEKLAWLDTQNPQIAARMALSLSRFAAFGATRQSQMKAALEALLKNNLSADLSEVVTKALQDAC